MQVRKVRAKGQISWHGNEHVFLTEVLIGERIGLLPDDDRYWTVYFLQLPIACFDSRRSCMLVAENTHDATITYRTTVPVCPANPFLQIFEPFFRVEEARNEESGGIGLGLSIAKQAVRLHRGTITARNTLPGLSVEITLPMLVAQSRQTSAGQLRSIE